MKLRDQIQVKEIRNDDEDPEYLWFDFGIGTRYIRRDLSHCHPPHRGRAAIELSRHLSVEPRALKEISNAMVGVEFKQKRWRLKGWRELRRNGI